MSKWWNGLCKTSLSTKVETNTRQASAAHAKSPHHIAHTGLADQQHVRVHDESSCEADLDLGIGPV